MLAAHAHGLCALRQWTWDPSCASQQVPNSHGGGGSCSRCTRHLGPVHMQHIAERVMCRAPKSCLAAKQPTHAHAASPCPSTGSSDMAGNCAAPMITADCVYNSSAPAWPARCAFASSSDHAGDIGASHPSACNLHTSVRFHRRRRVNRGRRVPANVAAGFARLQHVPGVLGALWSTGGGGRGRRLGRALPPAHPKRPAPRQQHPRGSAWLQSGPSRAAALCQPPPPQ